MNKAIGGFLLTAAFIIGLMGGALRNEAMEARLLSIATKHEAEAAQCQVSLDKTANELKSMTDNFWKSVALFGESKAAFDSLEATNRKLMAMARRWEPVGSGPVRISGSSVSALPLTGLPDDVCFVTVP